MNGKYKEIISNVFCIVLLILIVTGVSYLGSLDKTPRYKYEIVCKTKTIYCDEIDKKYQDDHYNLYYTNDGNEVDDVKIDDVTNIKILK